MFQHTRSRAKLACLLILHAMLVAPPGFGQPETPDNLKVRVQKLHTKGGRVSVTTSDKTVLRGRIVRVDEDSFTVREEKTAREAVIPFTRLKDIKDGGSRKRAILIPAAIVGGAVLVLCAAPYPIGFLCRKDPS
jgi:hypothetical protein